MFDQVAYEAKIIHPVYTHYIICVYFKKKFYWFQQTVTIWNSVKSIMARKVILWGKTQK